MGQSTGLLNRGLKVQFLLGLQNSFVAQLDRALVF